MYGIRNTKRKLKYQGMGAYQVVEITPQGAIRIATLDGVVMEGYINGSKLKKFYGPLTLQTLQTIHINQKRKKEETCHAPSFHNHEQNCSNIIITNEQEGRFQYESI